MSTPSLFCDLENQNYRYPHSKNIYSTKITESQLRVFSDQQTECHSGQWHQVFKKSPDTPIFVEIGCNAGHFLIEWAKQHPEHCFIGIDWKFKAIFRAAQKAEAAQIKNIYFCRARAERLPFIFQANEIHGFFLFFPDPWPKERHWKNRFLQPHRLKQLHSLLNAHGTLEIKTDYAEYFHSTLQWTQDQAPSWEILKQSKDLHKDHPSKEKLKIPEVTLFESLFIKKNMPIYGLKLKKSNSF